MLGIAYAASLGGVATLIGTPPNAIFAGVVEKTYGISISFLEWMVFALPMSAVMLSLCWIYLTRIVFARADLHLPGSQTFIREQIERLGAMTRQEKQVAAVFCTVAALWVLRGLYQPQGLAMVKDSTIAIGGALLLFMIPVDIRKGESAVLHAGDKLPELVVEPLPMNEKDLNRFGIRGAVSREAKKYSFQVKTRDRMNAATMPGRAMGRMIRTNAPHTP